MSDILNELRFWSQTIEDSRCTLICPPALADQLRALLDQYGVAGMYDVREDVHVGDRIVILDHNGIDATIRQAIQRLGSAST